MKTPRTIESVAPKDSSISLLSQLSGRGCLVTFLALVFACSGQDTLQILAAGHELNRGAVQSGDFTLTTLGPHLPEQVQHLRVYIGSDGRPWQGNKPSPEPTGERSLAVELMLQDPLPALYLGRPCYHSQASTLSCEPSLWTSGRYSQRVIRTMTGALDQIVQDHGVQQLTLVGYSGGGVIALLVASRLGATGFAASVPGPAQKLTVITIAANLDIDAWTEFHQHLPLTESLNPVAEVASPATFRQFHLVGGSDLVVPPATYQGYLDIHPDATVWHFDDFGHVCCWAQRWPEILEKLGDDVH